MSSDTFTQQVYRLVEAIPRGYVMTYGQIAALCDKPDAARIVGGIAHFGPQDLPWQRVVKKDGGLAGGYYGGLEGHANDLTKDGIRVNNYKIDIEKHLWWPE